MLFTENSSDIRWGNRTNENSGIGKIETACLVGKKTLKQHSSSADVCRDIALSENHTVSSRELLHLPKILPSQSIPYKSAELNKFIIRNNKNQEKTNCILIPREKNSHKFFGKMRK